MWFATLDPNEVLVSGLWTAVVASTILPRIGVTASSSVKVATACSTGCVSLLVMFIFSAVGSNMLIMWLISQGYSIISTLVGASILGAIGALAFARMFKPLPR